MKITVPELELKDGDGFKPEVDIFSREKYGSNLKSFVVATNEPLVIALDAPWGEGKTTFLKMWKGMLEDDEIACIYFDSFKNDYQKDPFIAISSQVYELIEENSDKSGEYKKRALEALKVLGKSGFGIGVKALTAGVLDGSILGSVSGDVASKLSGWADDVIEERISSAKSDRRSLDEFKSFLSQMPKSLSEKGKLVFIIDELDRCRPKFALDLLEQIKHIFSVENIVFVLATNRRQLEESVRCEYGANVDATRYLQKFFTVWCDLPKRNNRKVDNKELYIRYCLERMDYPDADSSNDVSVGCISCLSEHYSMSFREIEKSLTTFAIIFNVMGLHHDEPLMYVATSLAVIKNVYPDVYSKVSNGRASYDCLEREANLEGIEIGAFKTKNIMHPIRFWLRFCMVGEEEAFRMVDNQYNNSPYIRGAPMASQRMVRDVCDCIDNLHL